MLTIADTVHMPPSPQEVGALGFQGCGLELQRMGDQHNNRLAVAGGKRLDDRIQAPAVPALVRWVTHIMPTEYP